MEGLLKGLGAVIVAIIGGLAVWWLTTASESPITPTQVPTRRPATAVPTQRPQSFMERLEGSYTLVSWNRENNPIDLAIRVRDGTLRIDAAGNADWNIGMWDYGTNPSTPTSAPSRTRCGGRVSSQNQQIVWVSGSDRNEAINWERAMRSLYTETWTTFCGGQSSGTSDPFDLSLDEQSNGTVFLEMSNSEGTYRWQKDT